MKHGVPRRGAARFHKMPLHEYCTDKLNDFQRTNARRTARRSCQHRFFNLEKVDDEEVAAAERNDDLEEKYRSQIEEIVRSEANRILEEKLDPSEVSRLNSLSLVSLFESDDPSLILH